MLSREVMGILALWILWGNTLLIAAAAAKQVAAVWRWARALRPLPAGGIGGGLAVGRGQARAGGALSRYELTQVGRAGAARGRARTIHFADCSQSGQVHAGVVHTAAGPIHLPENAAAEVWPDPGALARAVSQVDDPAQFAALYEAARRPHGYARTVRIDLGVGLGVGAGQPLFIAGEVRAAAGRLELGPAPALGNRILVSALDPRGWVRGRIALGLLFIVAALGGAGVVTGLSLYPPVFGRVSTLGALLGLGFFLGIQPLGTAVRDALTRPGLAPVRGRLVEPEPALAVPAAPPPRIWTTQ
jgi:hypothetical protein